MKPSRVLLVVCAIAALHGAFFIAYQRPDWATEWSDQDGYRRLGQVLSTTGRFTRFPDAPTFVPEVIRTPAYPVFVAAIYKVAGTSQVGVAVAQTGIFVALCLLVFAIARRFVSEPVALAAAAATALFPPIPYFGALVMTEVWTTFWFTVAMAVAMRAVATRRASTFAWLGLVVALATLSRPVFVLFPIALALVGLVLFPLFGVRERPSASHWATTLVVFAVAMLPWFGYNYATLGRFTLSPAGGVGRGLWEGSWQATWSGRLQNELTHLADDLDDRAALDAAVAAVAAREKLPVAPMLEYVHQWEDIRTIWTAPTDPRERAFARVKADQEYQRVALDNLKRDSVSHLSRRLARGVFVLWAGEIPFRYSEINRLSPWIIRACWAAQVLLMLLALGGLAALVRRGAVREALILGAPLLYITAVHFPLLTEARQSLPAMPTVLLLATIGAASVVMPGATLTSPGTSSS